MREIKFRGKRVDNGEWVEGDLLTKYIHHQGFLTIVEHGCINYKITPETVGQFTGVIIKNGKMIYEWDIVKAFKANSGLDWEDDLYVVAFDSNFSQFVLKCVKSKNKNREGKIAMKGNNQPYLLKNATDIVGNIHDNSDLLK